MALWWVIVPDPDTDAVHRVSVNPGILDAELTGILRQIVSRYNEDEILF